MPTKFLCILLFWVTGNKSAFIFLKILSGRFSLPGVAYLYSLFLGPLFLYILLPSTPLKVTASRAMPLVFGSLFPFFYMAILVGFSKSSVCYRHESYTVYFLLFLFCMEFFLLYTIVMILWDTVTPIISLKVVLFSYLMKQNN